MKTPDQDPSSHSTSAGGPLTLAQQTENLLKRRSFTTELPALKELVGSYDFNNDKIQTKIKCYKWAGYSLLFAIPLISTLVAFMANASDEAPLGPPASWMQAWVPTMSLGLAVLTVINSIVKPAVRFERSCRVGIDFFHWRCAFLEKLEQIDLKKDGALLEYVTDARKEFRKLQLADIGLALPDQT